MHQFFCAGSIPGRLGRQRPLQKETSLFPAESPCDGGPDMIEVSKSSRLQRGGNGESLNGGDALPIFLLECQQAISHLLMQFPGWK